MWRASFERQQGRMLEIKFLWLPSCFLALRRRSHNFLAFVDITKSVNEKKSEKPCWDFAKTRMSGLLEKYTRMSDLLGKYTRMSGLLEKYTRMSGLLEKYTRMSGLLGKFTRMSGLLGKYTRMSGLLGKYTRMSGLLGKYTRMSGLLGKYTRMSGLLGKYTRMSGLLEKYTRMSGLLHNISKILLIRNHWIWAIGKQIQNVILNSRSQIQKLQHFIHRSSVIIFFRNSAMASEEHLEKPWLEVTQSINQLHKTANQGIWGVNFLRRRRNEDWYEQQRHWSESGAEVSCNVGPWII